MRIQLKHELEGLQYQSITTSHCSFDKGIAFSSEVCTRCSLVGFHTYSVRIVTLKLDESHSLIG